jgi:hypothetical protein
MKLKLTEERTEGPGRRKQIKLVRLKELPIECLALLGRLPARPVAVWVWHGLVRSGVVTSIAYGMKSVLCR